MISKTDRDWRRWSRMDPFHGVLGQGFDEEAMKDAEVRAKFFGRGEAHINRVLADLSKLGSVKTGSALDFGCGVGRLVRPLAQRFETVIGVDIAPDMLKLAAKSTSDQENVKLVLTLADASEILSRFDLVHSYIVLQHISPKQGLAIIRSLLNLVAPGGAFALHFTIGDSKRRRRLLNLFRYRFPPLQWANNLARGKPWNLPVSEMNAYDVGAVMRLVRDAGSEPVLARSFDQGGHNGLMVMGFTANPTAFVVA